MLNLLEGGSDSYASEIYLSLPEPSDGPFIWMTSW